MEQLYFKHFDDHVARFGQKTAILLEVGKFFEFYDYVHKTTGVARTNVQTLAELCGCVAEPRASSDPAYHRLFWGFPVASLNKYERVLVNAGYTVVVIVQVKDATGDVKERRVDHIGSPGTFMEGSVGQTVRREEQCMLGLYIEPYVDTSLRQQHWTVASTAFDIMTGKAVSTETDIILIDGKPVCDAIQPFWSMYPPAELVVYWVGNEHMLPPSKTDIEGLFTGQRPMIHIFTLDPKQEMTAAAERLRLAFLESVFRHDSALHICEVLGVSMYHFARRSLSHLLQFIKDHNPSYLTNLHEHTMWIDDERVLLGNAALEQLAMIPSHVDRQHESLLHWLQQGQTPMGRRAIRERCLTPIADIDELDGRQTRIEWLQSWSAAHEAEMELRGMYDLARLYRRFQLGNGTTDDLLQLMTTYIKAAKLIEMTRDTMLDAQELMEHLQSILSQFDESRIRISKSQVDGAVVVGSVHPWRRGIFPVLDAKEDEWRTLEASVLALKSKFESFIGDGECIAWTLKEEAPFTFSTTSRRANTIAAAMKRGKDKMDIKVITRGSTGTQAVIECAELDEANTAGIRIRSEWRTAVQEIWNMWWASWIESSLVSNVLDATLNWISNLDAELTFARLAREYGYCRPKYIASTDSAPAGLNIVNMRHPIIERVRTTSPYIPHSIALGSLSNEAGDGCAKSKGGILLYGVNAAGKSSLGKALGLTVLMAQCGIPVPASAMTLIPYTGLYTRILGNDNLWAGMSSFVVEMTEFRSILRNANERTLVIGDELCAGTETASATSIVAAGIQTLMRRRVQFLFATHLHELAEIPELTGHDTSCALYHLSVRSDAKSRRLVYDRILKPGCGSPMYGLEVCRGLDMDPEFLTAAFNIRKHMFDNTGARLSRYNANVIVDMCAVCGSSSSLETHHIVPQAVAATTGGFIAPGVHKNTASNLVPLCDECHTLHHMGMLEIRGWIDTSTGRKLDYTALN
jgi:DNA mismatch repair protein MutS